MPTRTAATMVPSRMPVNPGRNMKEQARPMQTSVQSTLVLTAPNSHLKSLTKARLMPSAASRTASALTCRKTPNPMTAQLNRQRITDQRYPDGSRGAISHMEKSVKAPKIKTTGIWSRCAGRNCLFSRAACTATKLRCIRMVTVPIVSGSARLSTYGVQEMGETPRLALADRAMPRDMMKSATIRTKQRRMCSPMLLRT